MATSPPPSNAPFTLVNPYGGPQHTYELESGEYGTKSAVYKRKDGQRVKWSDEFGWSAHDEKTQELLLVAWGVPAAKQGDKPAEGTWVGKKGVDSFVYDMKFGLSKEDMKARAQRLREAVGGVEM